MSLIDHQYFNALESEQSRNSIALECMSNNVGLYKKNRKELKGVKDVIHQITRYCEGLELADLTTMQEVVDALNLAAETVDSTRKELKYLKKTSHNERQHLALHILETEEIITGEKRLKPKGKHRDCACGSKKPIPKCPGIEGSKIYCG